MRLNLVFYAVYLLVVFGSLSLTHTGHVQITVFGATFAQSRWNERTQCEHNKSTLVPQHFQQNKSCLPYNSTQLFWLCIGMQRNLAQNRILIKLNIANWKIDMKKSLKNYQIQLSSYLLSSHRLLNSLFTTENYRDFKVKTCKFCVYVIRNQQYTNIQRFLSKFSSI